MIFWIQLKISKYDTLAIEWIHFNIFCLTHIITSSPQIRGDQPFQVQQCKTQWLLFRYLREFLSRKIDRICLMKRRNFMNSTIYRNKTEKLGETVSLRESACLISGKLIVTKYFHWRAHFRIILIYLLKNTFVNVVK